MDNYIDCLLDNLETTYFSRVLFTPEYQSHNAALGAATDALWESLSPRQRRLFLSYEEAHNALGAIEQRSFAHQAFLLAREIFR